MDGAKQTDTICTPLKHVSTQQIWGKMYASHFQEVKHDYKKEWDKNEEEEDDERERRLTYLTKSISTVCTPTTTI